MALSLLKSLAVIVPIFCMSVAVASQQPRECIGSESVCNSSDAASAQTSMQRPQRDHLLIQAGVSNARAKIAQDRRQNRTNFCTNANIRRRRRADGMCACRRRSGSQHLPQGWACAGDGIYELSPSTGTDSDDMGGGSGTAGRRSCLCIFDIDRTLTGRQENTEDCPRNRVAAGVHDPAYDPGDLTLSALSAEGINTTFCGGCYLGICSAGNAGGENSAERKFLLDNVLLTAPFSELALQEPDATVWSYDDDVRSPLVLSKPDKTKQYAVQDIQGWYLSKGIDILTSRVHFFGDRTENVQAFEDSHMSFNVHEISCRSRDWRRGGVIGYCGALPEEIDNTIGVHLCSDKAKEWLASAQCEDTPGWSNGYNCRKDGYGESEGCGSSGWTCAGYYAQGWCRAGGPTTKHRGAHGGSMNFPENNCCVCGGGSLLHNRSGLDP